MKRFLFCLLTLCWLALCSSPAVASKTSERKRQKASAESQRSELRQKLNVLKREISQTETARVTAADTLAASETAISKANRSLRELAHEQQQTETTLKQLNAEHQRLTATIHDQQQRLRKLLHEQYVTGNEDRFKLLLSGDNPNRINRELQYMGYVARAQAALLEQLRSNLAAVAQNQEKTRIAQATLTEIADEEQAQKNQLEQEKSRRAVLLSQLSSKLQTQRKEAGKLQRDQQRLGQLVDRLARLMAQQRKAAAAARKRQQAARKQQQAAQRNARGKIVAKSSGQSQPLVNQAVPSDEDGVVAGNFSRQRGKLKLPVRGTISARFGNKRDDAPSWKGLFIRAASGGEIRAVAAGKIVFADWLRGFGNLIIVDHGSQYMTIYGNNEALLKHAGDVVSPGDAIATVGNSGGNEHSGLYFEMRHKGRAFDPLGWVTIR